MRSGGQPDQVRPVSRARDCRDPSQMHIGFHMVKLDLEWCRFLGWCKQFSRLREMLMVRVIIFRERALGRCYATRYPFYTKGKRDRYRRILPFRTGRLLPRTLWEVCIEFTGSVQCLCEIAIQTAQRALEVLGHPVGYVDARIRTRNESEKELFLSEVSRGEMAVSHGVETRAFHAIGRAVLVRLRTDYRPLPSCGLGCISTMLGLGAVRHILQAFLQPKKNLKTLLSGLMVHDRRVWATAVVPHIADLDLPTLLHIADFVSVPPLPKVRLRDSDGSRNNWMGGQVGFDYVRSRPEQLAQALPVVLLRCNVCPGALRAQIFLSCGVCHGELMWLSKRKNATGNPKNACEGGGRKENAPRA